MRHDKRSPRVVIPQLLCVIVLAFGLCTGAFAANLDDGVAAYKRGDYATALANFKELAAQGNAEAQYDLGLMYDDARGVSQDYKLAVYWYAKAAEQGVSLAQSNLGFMYTKGQGVVQDFKQATYWFAKAAEQGVALAQYNLGVMYDNSRGVAQDYKQAVYWYAKAAAQGNADAQSNLGAMYVGGQGVVQDYVQAHMWFNLAASKGNDSGRKNRDIIEQRMTPQQIAEAQRLAGEWKPRSAAAPGRPIAAPSAPFPPELAGSGTGFYISTDGNVLTNAHVIDACSSLAVESIGKPAIEARLVASDARNDLAVIHAKGRAPRAAAFRSGSMRQGQSVVVYGFPLLGAVASSGNATTGNVSALAGLGDDTRLLQISAPVQPGNSGGPLMDMTGAVLGVVVGKLNAAKVMEVIGDIPQNINFAIKAHVVIGFLESHGVEYQTAPKAQEMNVSDVADSARAFSVRVLCYR